VKAIENFTGSSKKLYRASEREIRCSAKLLHVGQSVRMREQTAEHRFITSLAALFKFVHGAHSETRSSLVCHNSYKKRSAN